MQINLNGFHVNRRRKNNAQNKLIHVSIVLSCVLTNSSLQKEKKNVAILSASDSNRMWSNRLIKESLIHLCTNFISSLVTCINKIVEYKNYYYILILIAVLTHFEHHSIIAMLFIKFLVYVIWIQLLHKHTGEVSKSLEIAKILKHILKISQLIFLLLFSIIVYFRIVVYPIVDITVCKWTFFLYVYNII